MAKRARPARRQSAPLDRVELTQSPFAALVGLELPGASAAEVTTPMADVEREERLVFDRKVVVRREKKGRGGKTVTRISGLPAAQREALTERLKKSLGCGASHEGDDVVLLGSLVERAAIWLEAAGARAVVRSA